MRSTRLRALAVTVGAALVALCAQIIVAGQASADNGDNSGPCTNGEFCYSKDNPATNYQRDYWWSGNDSASPAYWYHVTQGMWTAVKVLNNASSANNRDNVCDVWVVDWNSTGTARVREQRFPRHPSTNQWVGFISGLGDHNDAHLRCNQY